MPWSTALADLNAAVVSDAAGFGEPVTLPSAAVVSGVFNLFDPRISSDQSEHGRALRPSQQPNPTLSLTDEAAALLSEGMLVPIREIQYRVTRLDPDGNGMTVAALAPAGEPRPDDQFRRWR